MSNCFKCGDETPEGVLECAVCAGGLTPCQLPIVEEMSDEEFNAKFMEVDWDKVKTVADVVNILRADCRTIFIAKNDADFAVLKKFLKPIEE
jgi:hypothetical protein